MSEQRTKLQPRRARVVKRLGVRVARGPDAAATSSPDTPTLTVGSSADNDLVLADPTVSRYHLELVRTPSGVAVADLGSRNGTFVGSVRVERAVVPPGTRLVIGSTTLIVEDAGDLVAPPDNPDERLPELVGDSPAMLEVARLVRRLAAVTSSVLVHGETGAGKEVVARALHSAGPRRSEPFVVVDCGSLPATLIESQLFGHDKGAFTGADTQRAGAFERAHRGTVFLDEIGELPLDVQPALLGVLERRRFCRVGGSAELEVDVRVLAATHRDLRAEVNAGRFRADLYYRLAVARIVVPPLRERPEDIGPLVEHFVELITGVPGENPLAAAIPDLARHTWSGNVRELRNVVESALVMGQIHLDGTAPQANPDMQTPSPVEPYRDARGRALAQFERDYLGRLIEQCDGNASEAARRAKMDRPYLLTLLRRHGLR